MGGTSTKPIAPALTKILNDIQENISTSSSNVCNGVYDAKQTINFGDISGCDDITISNVGNSMTSSVSANCMQSTDFKNLLQDKVTEQLNKLRSVGNGQAADEINTAIKTNVNVNQLSSCMATASKNQSILFGDVIIRRCPPSGGKINISDIENNMVSNFMLKCIQSESPLLTEAFSKIESLPPITPIPKDKVKPVANNTGMIVGITLGSVLLIIILCSIAYYLTNVRNSNQ